MKATEVLDRNLIRITTQDLRETIHLCQELIDTINNQEEVTFLREKLSTVIALINSLRHVDDAIDVDILESFRILVHDIMNLNEHNRITFNGDLIPIPEEVDITTYELIRDTNQNLAERPQIYQQELVKEITQSLKDGLQICQQLVNDIDTEEQEVTVKEELELMIAYINILRQHNAIDADALEAFRTLINDIRRLNEFTDFIPIPSEADDILENGRTSTLSSTSDNVVHHVVINTVPIEHNGANHLNYQTNDPNPLIGTYEDNSCIMM